MDRGFCLRIIWYHDMSGSAEAAVEVIFSAPPEKNGQR